MKKYADSVKDIQLQKSDLIGGKKSGRIVETKTGSVGLLYNSDSILVNGKVLVYTLDGNLMCDPKTLKMIGFFD